MLNLSISELYKYSPYGEHSLLRHLYFRWKSSLEQTFICGFFLYTSDSFRLCPLPRKITNGRGIFSHTLNHNNSTHISLFFSLYLSTCPKQLAISLHYSLSVTLVLLYVSMSHSFCCCCCCRASIFGKTPNVRNTEIDCIPFNKQTRKYFIRRECE